jgi:hypothetical protein
LNILTAEQLLDNQHPLPAQFKIKLFNNGKVEGDVEFLYLLHPHLSEFTDGVFGFSSMEKENIMVMMSMLILYYS